MIITEFDQGGQTGCLVRSKGEGGANQAPSRKLVVSFVKESEGPPRHHPLFNSPEPVADKSE